MPFIQINLTEFVEDISPTSVLGPSVEALEHRVPVAEARGQVTPGNTGFQDEENCIDKEAVVVGGNFTIERLSGQQVFNSFLLLIIQRMASLRYDFLTLIKPSDCQRNLTGKKSMFPATWSNSKSMNAVSEVATSNL